MKNKLLTFILSFVPGVGHLYLGQMNRGFQLLAIFFGSIFIINMIRIHELAFLLPVIWFYAVFDSLQQHQLIKDGIQVDQPIISWDKLALNHRWLAYILIGIGGLILFDNLFSIASTYFQYLWNIRLHSIIISLIFIFIGIKLLTGLKKENNNDPQRIKE